MEPKNSKYYKNNRNKNQSNRNKSKCQKKKTKRPKTTTGTRKRNETNFLNSRATRGDDTTMGIGSRGWHD